MFYKCLAQNLCSSLELLLKCKWGENRTHTYKLMELNQIHLLKLCQNDSRTQALGMPCDRRYELRDIRTLWQSTSVFTWPPTVYEKDACLHASWILLKILITFTETTSLTALQTGQLSYYSALGQVHIWNLQSRQKFVTLETMNIRSKQKWEFMKIYSCNFHHKTRRNNSWHLKCVKCSTGSLVSFQATLHFIAPQMWNQNHGQRIQASSSIENSPSTASL